MVPKIIHYCWFGKGKKTELVIKCINSWKKYCSGYKIVEWNEDNFDIFSNNYVKEAYSVKQWAFVTDYVRLCVLYKYGGIYMDTDVEVMKSLDPFLNYKAFVGFSVDAKGIDTGTIGSIKYNTWIKILLDNYQNRHFIRPDGKLDQTTNNATITYLTQKYYKVQPIDRIQSLNDLTIFPFSYFCATDWRTGKSFVDLNTHAIHHLASSWQTDKILYLQRGIYFYQCKDYINAEYCLKNALTLTAKYNDEVSAFYKANIFTACSMLGDIYNLQGQKKEAIKYYIKFLNKRPYSGEVFTKFYTMIKMKPLEMKVNLLSKIYKEKDIGFLLNVINDIELYTYYKCTYKGDIGLWENITKNREAEKYTSVANNMANTLKKSYKSIIINTLKNKEDLSVDMCAILPKEYQMAFQHIKIKIDI